MAIETDYLNATIIFKPGDHWVCLSRDVFYGLGIQKNETRVGLNMSPAIGMYCKGWRDNNIVHCIPLFSNEMKPGLIVSIDADEAFVEPAFKYLKEKYDGRIVLEDSDYDWPPDGKHILSEFDNPQLDLNDGVISILPPADV